jgi:hypothetical protein
MVDEQPWSEPVRYVQPTAAVLHGFNFRNFVVVSAKVLETRTPLQGSWAALENNVQV